MKVRLIDNEHNRQRKVVNKIGEKRYDTLGNLILTEDGIWVYYYPGNEFFEIIES